MTSTPPAPFGVGMIGYSFMGAAHSQAWRTAPRFFDLPVDPRMRVLVGRNHSAVTAAAAQLGWAGVETDWRALLDPGRHRSRRHLLPG